VFATYTYARVKQAIAWQRIIPWSHVFGRQDPYYDSPGGGLFLHWIFTVIAISSASEPKARLLFNGIYAYGYQLMFLFLAIGLLRLRTSMHDYTPNFKLTYLTNRVALVSVAVVFALINILTLVTYSLPQLPDQVPRFWWPISAFIVVCVALLYWAVLRLFQDTTSWQRDLGRKVGFHVQIYEDEDDVPDDMKFLMYEAHLDGTRRRISYKTSGHLGAWTTGFNRIKDIVVRFLAY